MKFPKLQQISSSRQLVDVFRGYNHNLRIGDGSQKKTKFFEFFDMKNMTSDFYPVMSPRGTRNTRIEFDAPINGVCANNVPCMVIGTDFLIEGYQPIQLGLTDGLKTLVSMGAYVIILPDKKWVNVAACMDTNGEYEESEKYGDIEASYSGQVTCYPCLANGELDTGYISHEKPTKPEGAEFTDGIRWMDSSVWPPVVKKWYAETGMWVEEKTYLRLACKDANGKKLGAIFSKGDTLTAATYEYKDDERKVYIPENPAVLESTDEYIVVSGIATRETPFAYDMSRTMPEMDFIIESGNRLWGCKYGSTEKGFLNEIYASKLGDFKNWNSFQGVSTDSYVASIGADGPFTGAVCYQNRPMFFKEDCMIEVYGSYPAAYQVQATSCAGVQKGCEKSLAIVNNILYYKTSCGICAFDGSLPVQIGQVFGQVQYEKAVACGHGRKYYISMRDTSCIQDPENGTEEGWSLFVYDAARGLWHREDETHVVYFFVDRNALFYVPYESNKVIDVACHNDELVEWMVQSGEIGLGLPDMKYLSRLTVRLALEEGSEVSFYVQYDFEDEWVHICTIPATNLRSFDIPIRPKRCDHMKLRIEGIGGAKIYSITKTIEQGSDIS